MNTGLVLVLVLCAAGETSAAPPEETDAATDDLAQVDAELQALLTTDVEVWLATKSLTRLDDVPAAVTVITEAQLRMWGYQSLAEALTHVLGFYDVDDHIVPNLAVRGVSSGLFGESNVVKVLVNGTPISFRTTGGHWLGPEMIPFTLVERIEIWTGPASALYGADAFLGAINIVTKSGTQLHGQTVRAGVGETGGNYGTYDVDIASGSRGDNWEYTLGVRATRDDLSGMRLPSSSPGVQLPPTMAAHSTTREQTLNSWVGYGTLTRHFANGGQVTLSPYFSAIQRAGELAAWAQLNHGTDASGDHLGTEISLAQALLDLSGQIPIADAHKLEFNLSGFMGAPTSRDSITAQSDLFQMERHFGYMGAEGLLQASGPVSSDLTYTAGVSVVLDREEKPSITRTVRHSAGPYSAGDELGTAEGEYVLLTNPGAFGQLSWNALERLSVVGGFRYDYHNIYGNQLSGRVAAVYEVAEGLHAKLMYGSAFKAPSPYLLYAVPVQPGDVAGNAKLAAQRANSVEAELRYQPHALLTLRTNLALTRVDNAAEFTQQGLNLIARNVSQTTSASWETRAELQTSALLLYGQFDWIYIFRDPGESGYAARLLGNQGPVFPSYQIYGGAHFAPASLPFKLSAEVVFVGPRLASATNALEAGDAYTLPSYVVLDCGIMSRNLGLFESGETTLQLTARNVLDSQGVMPGPAGVDYPQTPRRVALLIRQDF